MEEKFCLIGNSHISQFDNSKLNAIYGYGASICGLYNEKSVLRLKESILEYQKNNPEKTLVFFLGQSDLEFIYYFKSIKSNKKIDMNDFMNTLIKQYIEFIKTYIKRPIILGINPTVIKNTKHIFHVNFTEKTPNNPAGTYEPSIIYNDVKHYYDNFEVRFNNHVEFNKKLLEESKKNCIKYVDLWDEIIDENGNVKLIYTPNVEDHHLVKNFRLYEVLIEKIKDYI